MHVKGSKFLQLSAKVEPWNFFIALRLDFNPFSTLFFFIGRLICLNPKLLIQWLVNTFPQAGSAHLLGIDSINMARQKG
jgi:hypothetical protein